MFFLLKKKRKETKDRIIRDIWTLFETQEEKKRKKELTIIDKLIINLIKIKKLEMLRYFLNEKEKITINLKE